MNKSVYENNMKALEGKFPVWAGILRQYTRKQRNFSVVMERSYTDEPIMKIDKGGTVYYLNGKYAPSAAADRWMERQGEIDRFATIIIIGISNGVHIKRIMESVPKSVNILVYEPSYEIFRRAMEEVDLSFLFAPDIPVGIVVPKINGFEIGRYFKLLISYDNMVSLRLYLSGNYQRLFPEEIGKFLKYLNEYLETVTVGWNTKVRYTSIKAENVFHNLPYLYEGYSVADLKGILPPDVPAIIVSAGPSLNKNMLDLKAAMGRACIIATDTAMKPLLNAGILPDLFMIVDGLKPGELFQHKGISKVGMVTMTGVSRAPMDLHKGKKYFYADEFPFGDEMVREIGEKKGRDVNFPALPTGGSVATSAYSLALYMGAKTVILVGQDLALTGNKAHVDGAFENEKCVINMQSKAFMEVEAVGGGTVVTRNDLKLYLEWFEKAIKNWKQIRTIDATEGGALIHGAKNMTLKRAIKKYCTRKYNARWHIARIPRVLETDEEREIVLDYFEKSVDRLEAVQDKAREGLECYERIQELSGGRPEDQMQLQEALRKVKEINAFMEEDSMAGTVTESLKGVEYTLRPTIYHVRDQEAEELGDIAEQGRVMLAAIYYAAEEIKGIASETLIPFARQKRAGREGEGEG